jgi:hypothetical protein
LKLNGTHGTIDENNNRQASASVNGKAIKETLSSGG